ncbi:NADPH oxidase 4 isoform X2 [Petromyzon marinus]|uniref:NADPH oxidase 4 n=1 Tax=Petromyzon marinus TaxID=7757 RepID=A0AAJ7U9T4_PETMA|nr:NADPH oxidase 4 [Petromyzon marinus]
MALALRSWVFNEVWKHCSLMLWMAATTFVFCRTFLLYYYGPEYYYLHKMLGLGLCLSRASASAINLNCALILLPMCRTTLALLRGSRRVTSRGTRRLLDRNKSFHVACGIAIALFTGLHCAAHMVNAWNFSAHHSSQFPEINVVRYRNEDPRKILFTTVPGVTGILMVVILFLIGTSSTRQIRVTSYNVFWYTHSLYLIFFLLLLLHATGGVLKVQINLLEHPPGCDTHGRPGNATSLPGVGIPEPLPEGFAEPEPGMAKNSGVECRELPRFQSQIPEAWLWVSGPLCLYCAERVYRLIRSSRAVTVTSAAQHPGNVLEIRMLRPGFTARPGQYVLLHCPSVSTFESHPFTLTECPPDSKGNFAIHLRVLGDWTASLRDQLIRNQNPNMEYLRTSPAPPRQHPKLYIDGPFGSPAEEVFNYRVSLCVAGGIGVTPFAAVLNALLQQWAGVRLRRLYLVWVCKEARDFGWLAAVLTALHAKLWRENRPDFFSVRLFTTRSGALETLEDKYHALNSRMSVGRPCWRALFNEIAQCNQRTSVGVFCCGPQKMSRAVHRTCNRCNAHGTSFHYNKESFG